MKKLWPIKPYASCVHAFLKAKRCLTFDLKEIASNRSAGFSLEMIYLGSRTLSTCHFVRVGCSTVSAAASWLCLEILQE